jgi:phosphoribosylanthranilate isomerase
VFVKICGITTVDDALLAAGLGADAIGLNFWSGSSRRIGRETARDIVRRVPPEVLSVGIFRNERRERVVELANSVGLRAVQLHGGESPEDTRWVGERVPALIRAFGIDDPMLVSGADYGPHRLLVDSPMAGSGETFDWALIERRLGSRDYILAGGLDPDNVTEAIESLGPWGVDVASGVEASPGRKDPAKVRRFLAAARAAVPRPPIPVPAPATGGSPHPGSAHHHTSARRPFDWEEDNR